MEHHNDHFRRRIMITGGAGFIGSHLTRRLVRQYPDYLIVNVDKLTYAGNPDNLYDVRDYPNYRFVKADICDAEAMDSVLRTYDIDGVINLAAESHVDRSISDPLSFVRTNVLGTMTLLQAVTRYWEEKGDMASRRFLHVSTDEVFGALEPDTDDIFSETTRYNPHSPYSASKASSDHFVRAYHDTYGLPALVSNCSNNYGPNQFPEKLIPLFINNIRHNLPLPVYGNGENIRDWLYVGDHASALDTVFHKGIPGETYCIGGRNEWRNIDLIHKLIDVADRVLGRPVGASLSLITHVDDRKGHDMRYAIDNSKIENELGWRPLTSFEDGLELTIRWYLDNGLWLDRIASGEYRRGH